jgi:Ca-activated chloride channel homolog
MSIRTCVPAAAALLLVAPLLAQETQKFKVSTNTVALYVTVIDHDKRLVPDLIQEDFEVLDNGKPQTLTSFDNHPLPINVVVMLDTSGSMTLALDLVKHGAEEFLMRLMPDDKGLVGAFNDKIQFLPEGGFTGNRDRLTAQLPKLDFGYPTRLWDAVNESMTRLKETEGRKVVLVFTDGDDTASKNVGAGDVTDRARTDDIMVYSIGLENEFLNGSQRVRTSPDKGLKGLSAESGGGFFLLKKTDELGSTFTRVAQELHSQYVLGFSPAVLDNKVHKLEVRLKKTGLTARSRKSYVASASPTTEK